MDLSLLINTTLAQSTQTLAYTWNPVFTNLMVGFFLLVSFAMILLVLIQRPQGGGLSGAFGAGGGGGGAGQTAFGTKTGDVLTGATITVFLLFLVFAIVLNFATRPQVPVSNVPGISTPAEPGSGALGDPIEEDEPNTNAGEIEDPAQAVEDAMSTTPSLESNTPESDVPASSSDEPGTEPGTEPSDN